MLLHTHIRHLSRCAWTAQVFTALLTFKMASPAGKDCKDPTGKVRCCWLRAYGLGFNRGCDYSVLAHML
jgi:hypothetical protein